MSASHVLIPSALGSFFTAVKQNKNELISTYNCTDPHSEIYRYLCQENMDSDDEAEKFYKLIARGNPLLNKLVIDMFFAKRSLQQWCCNKDNTTYIRDANEHIVPLSILRRLLRKPQFSEICKYILENTQDHDLTDQEKVALLLTTLSRPEYTGLITIANQYAINNWQSTTKQNFYRLLMLHKSGLPTTTIQEQQNSSFSLSQSNLTSSSYSASSSASSSSSSSASSSSSSSVSSSSSSSSTLSNPSDNKSGKRKFHQTQQPPQTQPVSQLQPQLPLLSTIQNSSLQQQLNQQQKIYNDKIDSDRQQLQAERKELDLKLEEYQQLRQQQKQLRLDQQELQSQQEQLRLERQQLQLQQSQLQLDRQELLAQQEQLQQRHQQQAVSSSANTTSTTVIINTEHDFQTEKGIDDIHTKLRLLNDEILFNFGDQLGQIYIESINQLQTRFNQLINQAKTNLQSKEAQLKMINDLISPRYQTSSSNFFNNSSTQEIARLQVQRTQILNLINKMKYLLDCYTTVDTTALSEISTLELQLPPNQLPEQTSASSTSSYSHDHTNDLLHSCKPS